MYDYNTNKYIMKNKKEKNVSKSFYLKTLWGNLLLKGIRGYDGYFASSTGRIFTKRKTGELNQKTLFLEPNSNYLKVYLSKHGIRKGLYVHNIVGNTFKNRTKSEKTYSHIDKNYLNNDTRNLRVKRELSPRVTKESVYKFKSENLLQEMVAGMSPDKANILLTEYKKFRAGKTHRLCYNYLLLYGKGAES